MSKPKTYVVKVAPVPASVSGETQVGINGRIVTVPLGVETEVVEDVYEALQNSAYEVTVVAEAGAEAEGSADAPATAASSSPKPPKARARQVDKANAAE